MVLELFLWSFIFIIGLSVLIKASVYLMDSAETIGLFFRIPPFIIGSTFVAFGTSVPELISSIFAVLRGSSEIVVGNVVGSNITNVFLVLGVAAVVGKKLIVGHKLIHIDLPILMCSVFLLTVAVWDGVFTLPEAFICIAAAILYCLYAFNGGNRQESLETEWNKKSVEKGKTLGWKTFFNFALSSVFIYFSAKYTVEAVIRLSDILHIGKEIIAMSVVALGTSLPEMMVTVVAAKKGKAEMAVGNVLGSNVFNSLAVMAIPALFGNLLIPPNIISFGLPMVIIGSLLYFFATQDGEITKWEGWFFLIFYFLYIGKLFNLM